MYGRIAIRPYPNREGKELLTLVPILSLSTYKTEILMSYQKVLTIIKIFQENHAISPIIEYNLISYLSTLTKLCHSCETMSFLRNYVIPAKAGIHLFRSGFPPMRR